MTNPAVPLRNTLPLLTRSAAASVALLAVTCWCSSALAGGELPPIQASQSDQSAERVSQATELRTHYASRQAALSQTYAETMAIVGRVAYRNTERTRIYVPQKDQFGDPMYVAYGRRAYAGTPWYNGPSYVASFGSEADVPYHVLYGRPQLYWKGSLSEPGYVPRTDVTLGVGASHSYMQSGMVMDPGSVAPSYARPMQFNNR